MGVPQSGREAPRAEYANRLSLRRARERRLERRERIVSNSRLIVFLAGGAIAWLSLGAKAISPWLILAPAAGFAALVVFHDYVIRARHRARRAAAFYEAGLARLDDRFEGTGRSGTRFIDPDHPYALDLDLFGPRNLFERLSTARTRMGENALAAWLKAPGSPARIRDRQAAVGDLRPRLDLREDLATLADDGAAGVDPVALASWSTAAPRLSGTAPRYVAAGCSLLTSAALLGWGMWGAGPWWFVVCASIQGVLALALRSRVAAVVREVERPGQDLVLLAAVLQRLEHERFDSRYLQELRSALDAEGLAPSTRVAVLARRVERLNWRRNQIFAPLAALLLWNTQCALAIEAWRAAHGKAVPTWLSTVGEIEALGSLAGYGYEHPQDPFPEIVESGVLFDGAGLGHPLVPESRCVRNDVRLDSELRLLVVSGSNMSGKSTLLRTVGINAVLALAGAPVRAERLRVSPLAVGATLKVQDSLQEGSSRFYAEIKRIRQLVEIAGGPLPLLFLLDEVLHGTNSHDRRIGADAIVRALLDRGAVGLLTTHDLALSRIAETSRGVTNVHFEDHLEDGRITFDFKLRDGVVRKSNALELMRSIGLEV
jgi:hypothetical protein